MFTGKMAAIMEICKGKNDGIPFGFWQELPQFLPHCSSTGFKLEILEINDEKCCTNDGALLVEYKCPNVGAETRKSYNAGYVPPVVLLWPFHPKLKKKV